MRECFVLQWKNVTTDVPLEDAHVVDRDRKMFFVADGVTRRHAPGTPYPLRIASAAAERLVNGVHRELLERAVTPPDIREACRYANAAIRSLNMELGLWETCDFGVLDYAAATFAGVILRERDFLYATICDAGVARLANTGQYWWRTEDQHARAEPSFPKVYATTDIIAWTKDQRRRFRNRPGASHLTYGVFTGEDEALEYLETGVQPMDAGDTLLVFTDGLRPFLFGEEHGDFRGLLVEGSPEDLDRYVQRWAPERAGLGGDKTLIVVRV